MYESAVELGIEKAHSPVWRTFVLAIQAGLQVRTADCPSFCVDAIRSNQTVHPRSFIDFKNHAGRLAAVRCDPHHRWTED